MRLGGLHVCQHTCGGTFRCLQMHANILFLREASQTAGLSQILQRDPQQHAQVLLTQLHLQTSRIQASTRP